MNYLGTFNFLLKWLFITKVPSVYGLDKNVIGEFSQLYVPTQKGQKQ